MKNNIIIEATNLSKKFKKPALVNLSITVEEGTIYGILGPNGAGKTTLISILAGILKQDEGKVKIFNLDLDNTNERYIKEKINICSGYPNFIWGMTIYENLNYFGMLYGLNKKKRLEIIEKYINLLELNDYLHHRFDTLSTGIKQRVAFAKALINEPKVLFLDEPTLGLDPDIAIKIRKLIKRIQKENNITMLLTTHNMKEAEELCNIICFLKEGKKIVEATPTELKKIIKIKNRLDIMFKDRIVNFEFLNTIDGIISYKLDEDFIRMEIDDVERINSLLLEFNKRGISIRDLKIYESDLEDVFIELAK